MSVFRLAFGSVILLAAVSLTGTALAATKAYTTDTQEVPLHATSRQSSKTILSIPPASEVEVISSSGWAHVRFTKPDGQVRDGWVQSKFLGSRPPDSTIAKELNAENAVLKEQLGTLDNERTGLSQREKDLTEKLTKLNAAYEELKNGSANYVKLKTEFDSAKTSLASAQENIQNLIQENESLKLSQRMQWFAAGSFVLLFGWFLGWATGRRNKRKRGYYY